MTSRSRGHDTRDGKRREIRRSDAEGKGSPGRSAAIDGPRRRSSDASCPCEGQYGHAGFSHDRTCDGANDGRAGCEHGPDRVLFAIDGHRSQGRRLVVCRRRVAVSGVRAGPALAARRRRPALQSADGRDRVRAQEHENEQRCREASPDGDHDISISASGWTPEDVNGRLHGWCPEGSECACSGRRVRSHG